MKIGILTQWYEPESGPAALPAGLAKSLLNRGHEVIVLTGFPNYPTGKLPEGWKMRRHQAEDEDGVVVHRVKLYPSHDGSALKRLLNYSSFALSAVANGFNVLKSCDAVWVNYSPVTIGLPMFVTRYLHRVPTVIHVLDLWPDTLAASGFSTHPRLQPLLEKSLTWWCNRMYAAARAVAYISSSVGLALLERGVPSEKLSYIPMWANESVFQPSEENLREELDIPDSSVVLLYAGAMGEAQGLSALIRACSIVENRDFICLLAGSGTAESSLRQEALDAELENVRFLGQLPQESMARLYASADFCYISLNDHPLARMTMPSKTQAILAAGRAMLMAARGDVRGVAETSGAGFVAEPNDAASIAAAISAACNEGRPSLASRGAEGRKFYADNFSLEEATHRVEELLVKANRGKDNADESH